MRSIFFVALAAIAGLASANHVEAAKRQLPTDYGSYQDYGNYGNYGDYGAYPTSTSSA